MSFKIKEDHLTTICDFMDEHKDFASGRISAANAREKYRQLWNNLTLKLNSLGYGSKSTEKWQKTWADYKCNLKKKAAVVNKSRTLTGGGPEIEIKLTNIENRFLGILGTSFYAGCGVPERGLEHIINEQTQNIPSTSRKRSVEDDGEVQSIDHDYLATSSGSANTSPPVKRKKNDEIYTETIDCLKSIENTLANKLDNIRNILDLKLTDIYNAMKDKK